jgi:hypothetical protein
MKSGLRADFYTSMYFPQSVRTGAVLALLLVFIPPIHLVVKLAVVIASAVVLAAHYRLRIDNRNKEYFDHVWLMGMRWGEHGRFDTIDHLFVKRNKVRQTMHSRVSSTTIRSEQYDGYLRISEDNKIHLISSRNKESVLKRLKSLSLLLDVDILDYTGD